MPSSAPSAADGSGRRRASAPAAAPRSSATRGTVTPAARGSRPDLTPLTSFLPGRLYRSTGSRSEEHTSELQSRLHLVCRLLLEKKKKKTIIRPSYNES